MLTLFVLVVLGLHGTAAVSHTLQYYYTGSTGMEQFPKFVAVGIVDGQQIDYFDSVSEKNVLKQSWMEGVRDESSITDIRRGYVQTFSVGVGTLMQRFNQTTGVHILQRMYGCEWDDVTGDVTGYEQHGFDGEDFLVFDLKTETWVAPVPQAVITKNKWDHDRGYNAQQKNYFTHICPDWLKKYVNYGRSSLMRTDVPSVSLLQKSPSSPVSCHATGFYPDRAVMFWRKDGEELHEDVDQGEILPNHDGTFQMSVDLKPSSPEDWRRYDCVFQLHGLKDDIVTRLDEAVIRTNWETNMTMIIIIAVVVVALVFIICGIAGFFIYKKKKNVKRPPSPPSSQGEGLDESKELMK